MGGNGTAVRIALAAATLVTASGADAATLVIDVTGARSFGPAGSAGNAAATYQLGAGSRITAIAWDLSISTFGINRLGDATFRYGPEPTREASIMLSPAGVGDYYAGTKSYSGNVVFASQQAIKTVGPSGLLYTQFFDYFPYSNGSTHVQWNSGTITMTYELAALAADAPEPGTWGLMLAGSALVGGTLRRRRGRARAPA